MKLTRVHQLYVVDASYYTKVVFVCTDTQTHELLPAVQ